MEEKIEYERLKTPFPEKDIEWRVARSGAKNGKPWAMVLAYITSRAIQDRLDSVCGPDGWSNEFVKAPEGGILCGITINGVTKWDGAENTAVEAVKGGLSSAMKRSGAIWGIGRYLYGLTENFAEITTSGKFKGKTKDGTHFKWNPPKLPKWALPTKEEKGATKKERDHFIGILEKKDLLKYLSKPERDSIDMGGMGVTQTWMNDLYKELNKPQGVIEMLGEENGE